jgi:hypothetical protein
MQSPPRTVRAELACGIGNRSGGDCEESAIGDARHLSRCYGVRVRAERVRSCRKRALTLPSPASGRGEKRACEMRDVLRRNAAQ